MRPPHPAPMEDPQALKVGAFDLGPDPALIFDADGGLAGSNEAAQALFGRAVGGLTRDRFRLAFPAGSPLASLIERCTGQDGPVRERDLRIDLFGQPSFEVDADAGPLGAGAVLLTLRPRRSNPGLERASDMATVRSVVGLGHMLAHEIKNPLAGIRGAAQLLKTGATAADAPLAQLIVDETDRVRRLVDRMQAFSDDVTPASVGVNIHRVLDRVRALAANGVADGLAFREDYDPSLPRAWGEEDLLIQVFLNLVKNAAEAARSRRDGRGELGVFTAWRHGVRVHAPGVHGAQAAPLEVRVSDNGPGVPIALRDCLFEPFVTTKTHGAGLGLALVAKLVAAHGGRIDFESEPGRTEFRVLLPVAPAEAEEELAR